jgi:15-cis-phytoene synthase
MAGAAFAHCEALLREGDRDRWLAALFAPADKRPYLRALDAFALEIARVPDRVSEPMPGEIRLQWWRDALEGEGRGDASNPVAAALAETVARFRLPRAALLAMIDARVFELYDDPMPTLPDLEGWCGETASAPIRLASLVLAGGEDPGGADAAGHAGVAIGLTGLLRRFPWHARRGRVFVPADMLARHGVARAEIAAGTAGPGLHAALADLRRIARDHLRRAQDLLGTVAAPARPAFLPLSLVEPTLARMEGRDYRPFETAVDLPPWRKPWLLWRAARKMARR